MNTILLYTHLLFLSVAVVGIILADRSAIKWMRGTTNTVSKKVLFTAHWVVTTGLLGLIYSGLLLFWPMHAYLLKQPYFLTKMTLVFALLINAMCIEWLMHFAATHSYASLTPKQKIPLIVSGAISTLGWVGAALMSILQFGWLF